MLVPFRLGPGILAPVVQSYTLIKYIIKKKSCNLLPNSSLRIPNVLVKEVGWGVDKGQIIREDKVAKQKSLQFNLVL